MQLLRRTASAAPSGAAATCGSSCRRRGCGSLLIATPARAASASRRTSKTIDRLPAARLSGAALAAEAAGGDDDADGCGSDAALQPPAPPLRPVVTKINVVLAGSHAYLGRPDATDATDEEEEEEAAAADVAHYMDDAHYSFASDPDAWASTLEPLIVPGGSLQLVYRFQVCTATPCLPDRAACD